MAQPQHPSTTAPDRSRPPAPPDAGPLVTEPITTVAQVSTSEVAPQAPPFVVGTTPEPSALVQPAGDESSNSGVTSDTTTGAQESAHQAGQTGPAAEVAESETTVWEGRYSYRNFAGRLIGRLVATAAWLVIAAWMSTRSAEDSSRAVSVLTTVLGVLVLVAWVTLAWQTFYGRKSHLYRLTSRRLFVWTGIFQRRLDQVELLKVNDVYLRQPSIWHRWFGVGTVVVESSEQRYPITYLVGVDDPQSVMDLIWRTARAERDGRSVRVDQV